MKSDGTLPEWTSTITDASLANPSLTGTITTSGLTNNRIPFTNASGVLVIRLESSIRLVLITK